MIEGAIFDFDGTLFDSMFIWDNTGADFLRSVGKEPRSDLRAALKPLSLYQSALYCQQEYDLALSVEEIMAGFNRIAEGYYFHDVQPKPGVADFLARLQQAGAKMCIATATDRYQIEAALNRCGLAQYFSGIFTCTEVGHGKDEPFIFREALAHLGTGITRTVVFEDALHAAQTARADGFRVVGVYDAHESESAQVKALTDCYLTDFRNADAIWAWANQSCHREETTMKRCVIIGGADIQRYDRIRPLLRAGDFIVCCDSGLKHCNGLGVEPDLIVGDFDSHENPHLPVETIVLPCEKDDTDTVYAVKEALKRGYEDFLLLGVVGGRLDHTLGNVSILLMLDAKAKQARIIDDYSEMEIVSAQPVCIEDRYAFFSLLNVSGVAEGVTIRGAKYPLDNASITSEYQYGVSNEVLPGATAVVSVRKGRLLLIKVY